MDKILVVVFNSERGAYEGVRMLRELHAEGSISLYAEAVLAKDASGNVEVKEAGDQGPLGTAVGLVTGSLIGLLGGPAGVAIGAAVGTAGGSTYDLAAVGVSADFLEEVARAIEPGSAAVIAEVEEEWILPVDTRMEAAGGTVFRRTRGEVVHAMFERDQKAIQSEISAMKAEHDQATGEAKAKLQARIDASYAELRAAQDRANARSEAMHREVDAKVASLREQAAQARVERKQQLDMRRAEVEAEFKDLNAKLHHAMGQKQESTTS
jgi:uncharacterized membrane protein